MYDVLRGVRVVEVGSFVFVPLASAVLVDWGADVVKVEPPTTGDPYRGLSTAGMTNQVDGLHLSFEYANRGKRSIGLDLRDERGRELLATVVAGADVFMTNLRPSVRRRLHVDLDDIRSSNPDVVYVRGSGYGPRGPLADTAALDGTAYWARGGVAGALTPEGAERPLPQRPAFGDVMAAMILAGGVAGALYRRAVHGETSVVDVGLLNVGMWQVQRDVLSAPFDDGGGGPGNVPRTERNPLTGSYRTLDGRFISLAIVNPDPYWQELCAAIDRPDLAVDERFTTATARQQHNAECVGVLDEEFGSKPFAHWIEALEGFSGAWAPVQEPGDLHHDEQARSNGYFTAVQTSTGRELDVVSSPVTFDDLGAGRRMPGAPDLGQHTEEILLEAGRSWDELIALKDAGVIM